MAWTVLRQRIVFECCIIYRVRVEPSFVRYINHRLQYTKCSIRSMCWRKVNACTKVLRPILYLISAKMVCSVHCITVWPIFVSFCSAMLLIYISEETFIHSFDSSLSLSPSIIVCSNWSGKRWIWWFRTTIVDGGKSFDRLSNTKIDGHRFGRRQFNARDQSEYAWLHRCSATQKAIVNWW